jgi:hypothetical protein
MKYGLLLILALGCASAGAQELTDYQKQSLMYCLFDTKKGWARYEEHPHKTQFSYTMESLHHCDLRDLYVALWGKSKTKLKTRGDMLFIRMEPTPHHIYFLLGNEGQIVNHKGQPDIYDALGGIYTFHRLWVQLQVLAHRPVLDPEFTPPRDPDDVTCAFGHSMLDVYSKLDSNHP